ncbi:hypothetical protein KCP76_05510 [Salmonella enterica subsp. enterica serovar Weltevreden]|nr:hypothetical protein KCP76_05510 [Salmonella enterica subsp. enterica serovar Weltevreden]
MGLTPVRPQFGGTAPTCPRPKSASNKVEGNLRRKVVEPLVKSKVRTSPRAVVQAVREYHTGDVRISAPVFMPEAVTGRSSTNLLPVGRWQMCSSLLSIARWI